MKPCSIALFFTVLAAAGAPGSTPVISQAPPRSSVRDAWLIADSNVVADGERVWLSFVRGEAFPIAAVATPPGEVSEVQDRSGGATRSLPGLAAEDLGASTRIPLSGPGIHVMGCTSSVSTANEQVRLSQFDFAKTMIEILPASPDETGFETPLGHRLEITPLSNPCHWRTGERVKIRVLLEGHPWPNVEVAAGHEGQETRCYTTTTRTDSDGTAIFPLERAGHGFIRAHIERRTEGLGRPKIESLAATLSFRVRGFTNLSAGLQSVRAVHGRLDPWAVIGYRMGVRALKELELAAGSTDLEAVHRSPALPTVSGILDGVQAATRLSLGRLNLRREETGNEAVETIIGQPSTRRLLAFRPSESFFKRAANLQEENWSDVAQEIATWPDEQLFDMKSDIKPPPLRTAALSPAAPHATPSHSE